MSAAPIASLALMVVALVWSIALWRQLRDWRGGIFTAMLIAMAVHQGQRVLDWRADAPPGAAALWRPEHLHLLVESLLAALTVALLHLALRGRNALHARIDQQRSLMARAECLSGSGSWTWEIGDAAMTWSDGMHRLHGVDRASFTPSIGAIVALVAEGDRARFQETLDAAHDAHFEHQIIRPSGEMRTLTTEISVVRDDEGRPVRAYGAVHDVTSQRAAEDALRAARDRAETAAVVRSSFLASMSHEIRTPMTAILGYADLLLEPGLSQSERREHIETIRSSGAHLLGLLDDVLDLSKIEAGRLVIESIDTDLRALAHEVERLFRPRAAGRGLSIEVETPSEPVAVRTDPTRLRQILMNLVGNAIKFTDAGRVTIRVECDASTGRRIPVRITVADTGVGMSAEQQMRIFEPFRQAAASTTRKFGGTGLGLAICRRLANLLGGEISVESMPGEGSAFTLEMLAERGEASVVAPPVAGRTSAEGAGALTGRVLLVEDAEVNRRLFRTFLERFGLEVTEATNGQEGASAADAARRQGRPFSLVLMDVEMPVMNGLDAAAAMRAASHTMPIIALTANAMVGDRERCLAAGCSDYLAKPVDRLRLRSCVAQWLAPRALRASA